MPDPTSPEWLGSLPDDLKGNELLTTIPDVPSLARGFVEAKSADWTSGFPEELKASSSLARYKDPTSLGKAYLELEKKLGAHVTAPKEDSDPKEWDAYYKSLGRPDHPGLYQLSTPDDVPISGDDLSSLKGHAYKMGLTNRQAQQLLNSYAQDARDAMKEREEAYRATEETLQKRYGGNYTRNMAIANRAMKSVDADGSLNQFLKDTGLGNHPAVVELFVTFGKRMVEDGLIAGDVDGIATKEVALKKIAEIQADPNHPYHKSRFGDPIHQEVSQLYQIAYD